MTDLDIYTQGAEAFTLAETYAISDYEAAVHDDGISDCFDCFSVESIRAHESEFGQGETQAMLRRYAEMLNVWYLMLDQLLGDILTCTSEVTRYSLAATRYIKAMADEYHQARQNFEHVVTAWTLALLVGGADGDYPPPTDGVNLAMQTLTTEREC